MGTGELPHASVIYCLINIAPPNPTLAEGRGGRSSVGKRITFWRINQNGPTTVVTDSGPTGYAL